jgi:hypothetical protein
VVPGLQVIRYLFPPQTGEFTNMNVVFSGIYLICFKVLTDIENRKQIRKSIPVKGNAGQGETLKSVEYTILFIS